MQTERALFQHEPRTEQAVVCLFGAVLPFLDEPLIIESVQTPFPDCVARRLSDDSKVRIEFELRSSTFVEHNHDPTKCDLVVCWQNDMSNLPSGLQVLELYEVVERNCPWMIGRIERHPDAPWDRKRFFVRMSNERLERPTIQLTEALLSLAEVYGFGPRWLSGPEAVFVIGTEAQFFKVDATGRIGFPFSRLSDKSQFEELANRLNQALGRDLFSADDRNTKGKAWQVDELFESHDQLEAFFRVWQWYDASAGASEA